MCGICGIVGFSPLEDSDRQSVQTMNQTLIHRGPDSDGFFNDSQVALAMRRLKIIDLAHGNQPLYSHDRKLVMIFNGEIYNHVELRADLEKQGLQFNSHSDGETILGLYQLKKEKLLSDIRGMFAFVLYDIPAQKVLIARDRNSEKPFYYYEDNHKFIFASELKALVETLPQEKRKLSLNALNRFFHYQYIPEPQTPIECIQKLPAAHFIQIDLTSKKISVQKYWDLMDVPANHNQPEARIRESFEAVAPLIIRSEVPVGVALSGGIDSGAIAALATKHYPSQMHAFSIGYEGRPGMDERSMAQKLAEQIGMQYHEVEIKTQDVVNEFPKMVYYLDDPIADIAAFGYYQVARLARQKGVPVLLNGIGGDELFGGYFWSRRAIAKTLEKANFKKSGKLNYFKIISACLDQPREPGISIWKHVSQNFKSEKEKLTQHPNQFIFYDEMPGFSQSTQILKNLYTPEFYKKTDTNDIFAPFTISNWNDIPLQSLRFLFDTWLYSNCIALGDRMSMAHSVELRLPLMDHKLVETVMSIQKNNLAEYKLPHKQRFINAIRNLLPAEIFKRRKRGFTPPSQQWIKALIKNYGFYLKEGYLVKEKIIQPSQIAPVLSKHEFFSYKLILAEIWCRIYLYQEDYRSLKPQP